MNKVTTYTVDDLKPGEWETRRFCVVPKNSYSRACLSFSIAIKSKDGEVLLSVGNLYKRTISIGIYFCTFWAFYAKFEARTLKGMYKDALKFKHLCQQYILKNTVVGQPLPSVSEGKYKDFVWECFSQVSDLSFENL